ncbi:MAG: hypothetical protein J0H92_18655 [Sphingobacteriales bacterium]|jgi:hypothetical protein|nr:hypothetical protein [Sphingobacteriales bacterium]
MSAMKIILYALLIWFLYNLVFRFIIPIYRASRQMKRQFNQVRERMEEEQRRQQEASSAPGFQESQRPKAPPAGDYIDFEEVK